MQHVLHFIITFAFTFMVWKKLSVNRKNHQPIIFYDSVKHFTFAWANIFLYPYVHTSQFYKREKAFKSPILQHIFCFTENAIVHFSISEKIQYLQSHSQKVPLKRHGIVLFNIIHVAVDFFSVTPYWVSLP